MFLRNYIITFLVLLVLICGCESLRFAPGEVQKQNAYLHKQTARMASDTAVREGVSNELASLASLSALQSEAFILDYGFPDKLPAAENVSDILSDSSFAISRAASDASHIRPDAWAVADGAVDIAIALASLLGGAWGVRTISMLRKAKLKSNALREIVLGNELFKKQNSEMTTAFKTAHAVQSQPTRKIVAELKG